MRIIASAVATQSASATATLPATNIRVNVFRFSMINGVPKHSAITTKQQAIVGDHPPRCRKKT